MKIKKLLSLLLLVMILMNHTLGLANAELLESSDTPLSSMEFHALRAMGMLDDHFASLSANTNVSRAQFIGALSKVAGFDTVEYKAQDIPFIDVNPETLHKDEICYFYEAGYINGTSAGIFSPYEPITYNQAVKIIIDICGYREFVAAKYGTGLKAYNLMSISLNLAENMTVRNADAPLTAEMAVKLLLNAGRTPVLEPSYYTKNDSVYTSGIKEELFNVRNKIYYGEGVLKSNGAVSLLATDVNESTAVINSAEYMLPEVDLFSLIGCHVRFFYINDGSLSKLLWVGESDKNDYLLIESENLVPGDSRYSMESIVYKNGKKKNVAKLSPYVDIILAVCKSLKSQISRGFFYLIYDDFSPFLWYN